MADPKQQAEEQLQNTSEQKKQDILDSFQEFENYLKDKIHKGEKVGLNEDQLAKGAERVAEHLKNNNEPENPEEKLLQEMWKVAEDDEKSAMAKILVRLAKQEGQTS